MPSPTIVFGMNTMFAVRQFLPEILAMARDRGFRVVVIAPPGDTIPGVETYHVPLKREISIFWDLFALCRIWMILRSIRPAVVNMSTPKMGMVGGMAAWLAGVPERIYTLRGLRYETTRSWKRKLLMACEWVACACARHVICISLSVKQTVVRDGIITEAKATLLGERASEGISLSGRAVPAAALGFPEGSFVIGFVGRLTKDKGIRELVDAFRILRRDGLNVQLLLAGELETGDPVDAATVETIRADPNICWIGPVPNAAPYYPLMDVFVFPTYREGLSRVLLEAAAAGKPVVSTRTTGVIDEVVDGVTGLLVPPRDAAALARATRALLVNPELARRMGRNARRMVDEEFDNTIYLKRLGSMLESLAFDAEARTRGESAEKQTTAR
jgi:glycosyltransferase involved in cell wall biosynthesis